MSEPRYRCGAQPQPGDLILGPCRLDRRRMTVYLVLVIDGERSSDLHCATVSQPDAHTLPPRSGYVSPEWLVPAPLALASYDRGRECMVLARLAGEFCCSRDCVLLVRGGEAQPSEIAGRLFALPATESEVA